MSFDPKELRAAFGRFMTGVTVVTAKASDGTPVGFTANSFTSVSLDPPLLLVCPGKHLSSYDAFARTNHFAVSILAEGQEDVSNIFARSGGDKFGATHWTDAANGAALVTGRAAGFACTTRQKIDAGDHLILIGEVTGFDTADKRGLGYAGGGYFSLGQERLANAAPAGRKTSAGVIIERDGAVLLTDAGTLPTIDLGPAEGARNALAARLAGMGLTPQLGPVYSIWDDRHTRMIYLRGTAKGTPKSGHFVPLDTATLADPAAETMLRRFASELRTQSFSFYVGDAQHGDIHTTSED